VEYPAAYLAGAGSAGAAVTGTNGAVWLRLLSNPAGRVTPAKDKEKMNKSEKKELIYNIALLRYFTNALTGSIAVIKCFQELAVETAEILFSKYGTEQEYEKYSDFFLHHHSFQDLVGKVHKIPSLGEMPDNIIQFQKAVDPAHSFIPDMIVCPDCRTAFFQVGQGAVNHRGYEAPETVRNAVPLLCLHQSALYLPHICHTGTPVRAPVSHFIILPLPPLRLHPFYAVPEASHTPADAMIWFQQPIHKAIPIYHQALPIPHRRSLFPGRCITDDPLPC
jgi:hypothetical protein